MHPLPAIVVALTALSGSASGCAAIDPETTDSAPTPALTDQPCVVDLATDAAARWPDPFDLGPVRADAFTSVEIPDLDGDGEPEVAFVHEERGCGASMNCLHMLYLSNDGCPRFADALWAGWETLVPAEPGVVGVDGLRSVSVWLKDGCAGRAGEYRMFEWDGDRYVQFDSIYCDCDEDADGAVVDAVHRPEACQW